MSFVLNRNVKEAKVINYYGGNINVTLENNKTINLGSISNNNSIEMNNLKKVYLIKIGQQNNNGKNIFLVAATKKFNETQVMQENVEEKIVMTNSNYNLLSKSKNPASNNTSSNNNEEELIPYKKMSETPVETKEINFGNATRESNKKILSNNLTRKRDELKKKVNSTLKGIKDKKRKDKISSLTTMEQEVNKLELKNTNKDSFKNNYNQMKKKIYNARQVALKSL